jgi:hypothetical protein
MITALVVAGCYGVAWIALSCGYETQLMIGDLALAFAVLVWLEGISYSLRKSAVPAK